MKKAPFGNANSMTYLIMRSGRVMVKTLRKRFSEHYPEIPVEHWGILIQLWKGDGKTQKELANQVMKDKGTITRALAFLEELNIVVKIPDKQDKRSKRIYLTQKGKFLEEEVAPLVAKFNAEVLDGISEGEINICKKVLENIYNNSNY